jgi:hypothetical protein
MERPKDINVKIVELLLTHGANPNLMYIVPVANRRQTGGDKTHRQGSLLSHVLEKGRNDIAKLLVSYGADCWWPEKDGSVRSTLRSPISSLIVAQFVPGKSRKTAALIDMIEFLLTGGVGALDSSSSSSESLNDTLELDSSSEPANDDVLLNNSSAKDVLHDALLNNSSKDDALHDALKTVAYHHLAFSPYMPPYKNEIPDRQLKTACAVALHLILKGAKFQMQWEFDRFVKVAPGEIIKQIRKAAVEKGCDSTNWKEEYFLEDIHPVSDVEDDDW